MIRTLGLLQVPSQLNDNSLLKTLFGDPLYDCIDYYTLLMRKISLKQTVKNDFSN